MTENSTGMIGLGLLGSAMAARLMDCGWSVTGFDIDPARVAAGGTAAASAAAVARQCRLVVLSLPHSGVSASVLEGLAPALSPGSLVVDTTTGDPEAIAAFGRQLAEKGIRYVDATIGGSSRQARSGEVIAMCGGEEAAYAECEPLLACLARRSFHVGPCGSGARMKLVFNLVLGLNRAVLAEGLSFARAYGVDPARALEVLRAGPASSGVMDTKGVKMISGDFAPEARLSQHLKDVRLILEAGRRNHARLPLSELHARLLEEVEAAGFGGEDNSAIVRAFIATA